MSDLPFQTDSWVYSQKRTFPRILNSYCTVTPSGYLIFAGKILWENSKDSGEKLIGERAIAKDRSLYCSIGSVKSFMKEFRENIIDKEKKGSCRGRKLS